MTSHDLLSRIRFLFVISTSLCEIWYFAFMTSPRAPVTKGCGDYGSWFSVTVYRIPLVSIHGAFEDEGAGPPCSPFAY